MSAFPHVVLVLAHGSIVVWMFRLWRTKRAPGDLLIATICGTIAYDNLIGIVAVLSGADAIMETMSGMRWAMHSIFTPFMMIIVMEISAAAGNQTVRKPPVKALVWTTVLLFSGHGIVVDLMGIDLGLPAIDDFGALLGARIGTLVTEALILVLGADLWRRHGWPWLFVGGVAMLAAAITRPVVLGLNLGNDGAIILLVAFAVSAARLARPERQTDALDTIANRPPEPAD
ncbi:MAG: hypothetical protein ACR2QV_16365 [Gammaproteobacteria bacterium]